MRKTLKRQQDRQRIHPVACCARCGTELYPTDPCWHISRMLLCDDCIGPWLREELRPFRMSAEEVGL